MSGMTERGRSAHVLEYPLNSANIVTVRHIPSGGELGHITRCRLDAGVSVGRRRKRWARPEGI
jgi:hypothetical protein